MLSVTDDTFDEQVIKSTTPVVVDFWAPWCGPCKVLGPVLESLAPEVESLVHIVKVNVDDAIDVSRQYQIRSIPTLLLFRDGKVVSTMVGANSKQKVREWIENNIQK
jgi:thioredoxin 1